MGNYLNPGNSGFSGIRNDIYVDKSGLIGLINQTIDTPRRLTCISRPRRFGKSFAAKMLCAYYDKTCDSAGLFDDLKIAEDKGYREHLNRYDVIYLDMTEAIGGASVEEVVPYIQRNVVRELTEQYPGVKSAEGFAAMLANAAFFLSKKTAPSPPYRISWSIPWSSPDSSGPMWDLRKERSVGSARCMEAILR